MLFVVQTWRFGHKADPDTSLSGEIEADSFKEAMIYVSCHDLAKVGDLITVAGDVNNTGIVRIGWSGRVVFMKQDIGPEGGPGTVHDDEVMSIASQELEEESPYLSIVN